MFIEKIKKFKPSKRKIIQLYTALLFNSNLYSFVTDNKASNIYTGVSKVACVPGLNCYSCPGAIGACPLGSLQGSFSAEKSTIFYVLGILLIYAIMFGRTICGWLCPFGLIQELLYKIKTPKLKKNAVTKILSYFKYVVLVFFVFIVPITYAFRDNPLPAFCKYICPAGTLEGGISILANKVNDGFFSMLGPLFTWKFLLLVSTVVACVFIFRMFCRFICPLGALYGLFNKISFLGVKVDNHKCTNCGLCVNKCKLDIKNVGDAECINCGECVNVCPTDAIRWKFTKNKPDVLKKEKNKKMRIITRITTAILMCALLLTSIGCYWNESSNKLKYGTEIGDMCYEAELPIVTADEITNNTINPTKTNKITVINFWGTWCTPCVSELPDFDKIATDYKDTVTVVAIHSYSGRETSAGYIKEHYPNSDIIFANDISKDDSAFNGEYYLNLGGSNAYPYTVIIDENGIITHIFDRSLHYDDLKQAITEIQK